MAKKRRRRLVIDASVARASGGKDAAPPVSKRCRSFLMAVLEICHRMVLTGQIAAEWKKHASGFARRWRVSMEARKKVKRPGDVVDRALRERIAVTASNPSGRDAMLKDVHLVEAALATDRTVVSLDDAARSLFSSATGKVGRLKNVVWVNPANQKEKPIDWLKGGAKPEKARRLS